MAATRIENTRKCIINKDRQRWLTAISSEVIYLTNFQNIWFPFISIWTNFPLLLGVLAPIHMVLLCVVYVVWLHYEWVTMHSVDWIAFKELNIKKKEISKYVTDLLYHNGMKQMQARLQIELMHTFCAISIVRVNYDFIDVLGKFFFNSRTTLI